MSDIKKESMASLLSPKREGMKLVNVKFFRGERDLIRPDEFRAQLRTVADQHRAGSAERAEGAPRSTRPLTNVREFVADL